MKLINKIFLSIGLVAGSTAFVSCDLTTETQSSFDESVVFSNYTLAEFNVFGIYNAFGEQNSLRGRYQPYYGLNSDIELFNDTSKDDDKSKIVRYKMMAVNSELANANGAILVIPFFSNLYLSFSIKYSNSFLSLHSPSS